MKVSSDILLTIIGKKDVELYAAHVKLAESIKQVEALKAEINGAKEKEADGNRPDEES